VTENAQSTPKPAATKQAKPPSSSGRYSLILLIILCLGAIGAAAYFFWDRSNSQQQALMSMAKQQDALAQKLRSNQRVLEGLQVAMGSDQKQLIAHQNQLSALETQAERQTAQLLRLGGDSRKDWLIAEVEFLIRLANQRLGIEQDVLASISLLRAADDVLNELDEPKFFKVRELIAEELYLLDSTQNVDVEALYAQLSNLSKKVKGLTSNVEVVRETSAASVSNASAKDEPRVERFLRLMKESFLQAVTIQRLDQQVAALNTPEYDTYIRRYLQLSIEQAKLALFRNDQEVYHLELDEAIRWLNEQFASDAADVYAFKNTLKNLRDVTIAREMPDISGSLATVRQLVKNTYQEKESVDKKVLTASSGQDLFSAETESAEQKDEPSGIRVNEDEIELAEDTATETDSNKTESEPPEVGSDQ
jgi:uroporphyrin-3 C-methyltransferase